MQSSEQEHHSLQVKAWLVQNISSRLYCMFKACNISRVICAPPSTHLGCTCSRVTRTLRFC